MSREWSDKTSPEGRVRFAKRVAAELARLQKDPDAWAEYLGEAEATETRDGIDP